VHCHRPPHRAPRNPWPEADPACFITSRLGLLLIMLAVYVVQRIISLTLAYAQPCADLPENSFSQPRKVGWAPITLPCTCCSCARLQAGTNAPCNSIWTLALHSTRVAQGAPHWLEACQPRQPPRRERPHWPGHCEQRAVQHLLGTPSALPGKDSLAKPTPHSTLDSAASIT
jgi:hypothetical protein